MQFERTETEKKRKAERLKQVLVLQKLLNNINNEYYVDRSGYGDFICLHKFGAIGKICLGNTFEEAIKLLKLGTEKVNKHLKDKVIHFSSNEEYIDTQQRKNDKYSEKIRKHFGLEPGEPTPLFY